MNGCKPAFIRVSSVSQPFGLELIESILSNHGQIISHHPEQRHMLRSRLVPLLIRNFSERLPFPITLRTIRILNLLLRDHLDMLISECEISLGLMNHMMDPEASPLWKRAMCLEVFRGLFADPRRMIRVFGHFDHKEDKRPIINDTLTAFVRLATDGSLTRRDDADQAVAEAGVLAGVINSSSSGLKEATHMPQWTAVKTPCLKQLDKTEPPKLPQDYVHTLVLACMTNLGESLAKFILPLTVAEAKSKKRAQLGEMLSNESALPAPAIQPSESAFRVPTNTIRAHAECALPNPLDLRDHSMDADAKLVARFITKCWPPILATCSPYLDVFLDYGSFRALVRAVQKLTHVAGLLQLSTPRDAFLTALGKAAIPPASLLVRHLTPKTPVSDRQSRLADSKGSADVENLPIRTATPSPEKSQSSTQDGGALVMGLPNLLCLRALLNLAIALGPDLQSAWSIILETLQIADIVMAAPSSHSLGQVTLSRETCEVDPASEDIGVAMSAVRTAEQRLFECTADFPNEAYLHLLRSFCALLLRDVAISSANSKNRAQQTGVPSLHLELTPNVRGIQFALTKLDQLTQINQRRMLEPDETKQAWNVLATELAPFRSDPRILPGLRIQAGEILCRAVTRTAELFKMSEQHENVLNGMLSALQSQITALLRTSGGNSDRIDEAGMHIHRRSLEALKHVIELCGESLKSGWKTALNCLSSVFQQSGQLSTDEQAGATEHALEYSSNYRHGMISRDLARPAFGSVQLVCSDFIEAVPEQSLAILVGVLLDFCGQQEDLNMSLTVRSSKHSCAMHPAPSPASSLALNALTQRLILPRRSLSSGTFRTFYSHDASCPSFRAH